MIIGVMLLVFGLLHFNYIRVLGGIGMIAVYFILVKKERD